MPLLQLGREMAKYGLWDRRPALALVSSCVEAARITNQGGLVNNSIHHGVRVFDSLSMENSMPSCSKAGAHSRSDRSWSLRVRRETPEIGLSLGSCSVGSSPIILLGHRARAVDFLLGRSSSC